MTPGDVGARALPWPGERAWRLAALGAIVLLAAALRFADLGQLGYANHYYAAAVKSMLQSWHNFFFVAAEPGGAVSVDKPPVGLWLQVFSAAIFGVNAFGLLLPEILAGLASVIVVYHLVRRSFGTGAGLLAALVLAITPVVVATDRNNTMDSPLVLTLLLAAWAFVKATESGRLRYLLLGAVLAGVGFNIKMLEAYLPLPAFIALYFLGAAVPLRRKIGHLALAGVLLLAVSLAWPLAVDLTPADQRPYVGSSGDNSELSLITGYNGLSRLLGMGGGRPRNAPAGAGASTPIGPQGRMPQVPPQGPGGSPQAGQNGFPQPGQNGAPQSGRNDGLPRGAFGGGGGLDTGSAGILRLVIPPLSKEASWLLPFALLGLGLLVFGTRVRWPLSAPHGAAVLWGGWALAAGAFFSVAGFFHPYYLTTMGPPLATLTGIAAVALWRLRAPHPWLALALLVAGAAATLGVQWLTASVYVGNAWWWPFVLALVVLGAGLFAAVARRSAPRLARAGLTCVLAGLLVTPGMWSALTTMHSSANQSLPAAYAGARESTGPANGGTTSVNGALLDFLQANTQGMKYLMAVPSSMQGADYVLATGRPVLYLGGFMGQDEVVTGAGLAEMVANGELRYVYWDGDGGGGGVKSDVTSWVTSYCTAVPGFETMTQNSGAPDGTAGRVGGMGNMRVALYDCSARAGR